MKKIYSNKIIISKNYLKKEFINKRKKIKQIALDLKCSKSVIQRYLSLYHLKRKRLIYYCIEKKCDRIVSRMNNRCLSCETKRKYKEGILNNKGICNGRYGKGYLIEKENNSNWREGISKLLYPFEFNSKLKSKIRVRDNHICQNCGITEKEHLQLYNRVLCIHHIDYNKQNCNEYNLISVCITCNGKANKDRINTKEYYKYLNYINLFYEDYIY